MNLVHGSHRRVLIIPRIIMYRTQEGSHGKEEPNRFILFKPGMTNMFPMHGNVFHR